jgi:hypothetical protein
VRIRRRRWGVVEAESRQAVSEDLVCDVGVGVDGVVDAVEGLEDVDRWRGEGLPVVGFEGVEVLAAAVGGVEVGGAAVLTVGMVQPLDL